MVRVSLRWPEAVRDGQMSEEVRGDQRWLEKV